MDNIKRICLWSGPRNISTALMYAFAQRKDTKVFDEPLYAYYLKNNFDAQAYHPGAKVILETMQNNGNKVIEMMLTENEKPVLFFKQMTHHLLGLNRHFMTQMTNVILTRDPQEMLPSFDKVIKNPTIDDVGYKLHVDLIDYFLEYKIPFTVLDSKKVLLNPEAELTKLCEFANIPFSKNMLKWSPQKRVEDGVWAKYWYTNVHRSSGFIAYKPKEDKFPKHLIHLLNECLPYYNKLKTHTI
ncbi:sulfotransferase family protein [uncultured Winogradskyella sp.]|uniref:sulfotransferase-like domain-containing protein n=1 Tax=uncultured Winogradskyella sp. TaxID=395353 RepID=UPI0030DACB15|tara:strand:+ start:215363 stop:216088 length:726 start_codon:yes stop_codon:yes gene_type:complete